MKYLIIAIFAFITNCTFGQNAYQNNLYNLNSEIKTMENRLKNEDLSQQLLSDKLDLVKSLNRLGEEVISESIDGLIDSELAELISFACEFGKQKLNLLESYKAYHNDFFLKNYNDISSIYLSFYLKVKTKE